MDDIVRDPRNHSPSKYLEDREDWQSRIIALEDEVKRLREMVGLPKKTGLDEFFWSDGTNFN